MRIEMIALFKRTPVWPPAALALFAALMLVALTKGICCIASDGLPPSSQSENPISAATKSQPAKPAFDRANKKTPVDKAASTAIMEQNVYALSNEFSNLILAGRASLKQGRDDDAESAFQKARSIQYSNPTADYHLGLIKVRREMARLRNIPKEKIFPKIKAPEGSNGSKVYSDVNPHDFIQSADKTVFETVTGLKPDDSATNDVGKHEYEVVQFFSDVTGFEFEPISVKSKSASSKWENTKRGMSFYQASPSGPFRGVLIVKASASEIGRVEEAVQAIRVLNATPPYVEVRCFLMEIPQADSEALGFLPQSTNRLEVLSGPQYRAVQRTLASRKDVRIMDRECTVFCTHSEEKTPKLSMRGYSVQITPEFSLESQTVKVSLDFGFWGYPDSAPNAKASIDEPPRIRFARDFAVLDGQTAVLGGFSNEDAVLAENKRKLVIFLTPARIDRFSQRLD